MGEDKVLLKGDQIFVVRASQRCNMSFQKAEWFDSGGNRQTIWPYQYSTVSNVARRIGNQLSQSNQLSQKVAVVRQKLPLEQGKT